MKLRLILPVLFLSLSFFTDSFSREAQQARGPWLIKKHVIKTDRGNFKFEIHFEKINLSFAQRVLEVLSSDAPKVFEYFRFVPEWTVHFIIDEANNSNGSATIFPTNIIRLNNFPPLGMEFLSSEEDWIRGLVVHELAHIVHMDQTNGIFKVLTTIFGSAGKALGNLHPHWFSEGLATWVETEFTDAGRLRSKLMEFSLKERILEKDFCQSVDCLDDPGRYPFRGFRYWIGSWFLKYLEDMKPGTIRCLVEENSYRTLVFLNSTFKDCVGNLNVENAFKRFKKNIVGKIRKEQRETKKDPFVRKMKRFKLPESEEAIDWEIGFEILGGELFHAQLDEQAEEVRYLAIRDEKGNLKRKRRFDFPINQIQPPSDYSRKSKSLVIALSKLDENEKGELDIDRRWITYHPESDRVLNLTFKENPHYVFEISERKFLYLVYKDNRWLLRLKEKAADRLLYEFQLLDHISRPHFEKGTLSFKLYRSFGGQPHDKWSYHKLRIKGRRVMQHRVGMSSSTPFEYLFSCREQDVFRTIDDRLVVSRSFAGNKNSGNYERIFIDVPWARHLSALRTRGDRGFLLLGSDPEHGYLFNFKCDEVMKELTLEVAQKEVAPKTKFSKSEYVSSIDEEELDRYPNLDHFLPHFWYFQYAAGDNVSVYTAETTLVDPMGRHKFDLAWQYYTGADESSPLASYDYYRDSFLFGTSFGKLYSLSTVQDRTESNELSTAYIAYDKTWGYWSYIPSLNYSKSMIKDWISNRNLAVSRLAQKVTYRSKFKDDLFQGFKLDYTASSYSPKRRKDYIGNSLRFDMEMKFSKNFYSRARATFEKLDKDDLVSGVVYGGGHEGIGYKKMHEFYGLPESSLFGNEIYTGRLQLGLELFEPYTAGGGLFPFYFKEIHALLGVDKARADFTFINSRFVRDKELTSYHAGGRFDLTIFYNLPVTVDLIYAQVKSPVGNDVNDFLTVVTGRFTP